MVLAKRNYKIYANLGLKVRSTKRFVIILGTETSNSFNRVNEIPPSMGHKIKKLDKAWNICNDNGSTGPLLGTIDVQIGTSTEFVTLLVTDRFANPVMFVCDVCNGHVEMIKPSLAIVKMDNGWRTDIVRQP